MSSVLSSDPLEPDEDPEDDSASKPEDSFGLLFTGVFNGEDDDAELHGGDELQAALLARLTTRAKVGLHLELPSLDPTRYEVEDMEGRGGMGVVYRVRDLVFGRVVALKAVHPSASASQVRAFEEEARRIAGLGHPGIVPVYEMGRDLGERPYFTMKLVEGVDFSSVIAASRESSAPSARAGGLGTLLKACDAVAYAHSETGGKLLHRDLKPANIRVGEYGEAYVLDWGIAVAQGSATGGPAGTPYYMSPEQARGETLDITTDVYALGAVIYALYAGRAPYDDGSVERSPREMLAQVIAGAPAPLRRVARHPVPAEVLSIVEKAMMRDSSARYGSVTKLAADVRAFLENRVVVAHRTGATVELRKWVVRNSLVSGTALISLLAMAALLFMSAFSQARALQREIDPLIAIELAERESSLRELHPDTLPALLGWLSDADDLRTRSPKLTARGDAAGDVTPLDVRDAARYQRLVAASNEVKTWGTARKELQAQGPAKEDRYTAVRNRVSRIRQLERESLVDAKSAWDKMRDDLAMSPAYAGLHFSPRFGLVPLGADPVSGWQEFVHLPSGTVPRRHLETRALELAPENGIILVLIPGGRFHMGAQKASTRDPNYDPNPKPNESPIRLVGLAPMLFGKHEITQAQWLRMTGESPSQYREDTMESCTPLNPVENVSWTTVARVLREHGLVMPTEAQWEYVARAGSGSRWQTGTERHWLIGRANLADQSAADVGRDTEAAATWPEFNDGFIVHAPVDALAPNPWGVHGLFGNVREWCLDPYAGYSAPLGDGDGVCLAKHGRKRATRSASYVDNYYHSRCSQRCVFPPAYENSHLGARAALTLN